MCSVYHSDLSPSTIQDLVEHGYTLDPLSRTVQPHLQNQHTSVNNTTECTACFDFFGVSKYINVFSLYEIGQDMLVKLPYKFPSDSTIQSITCLSSQSTTIDITDATLEGCWLLLPISILDSSAGKKVYKLEFKYDATSESVITFYFGYILQDTDVEKPYVYMNTEGDTE